MTLEDTISPETAAQLRAWVTQIGRKGGKSRSIPKALAARRNLVKARAAKVGLSPGKDSTKEGVS